MDDINQFEVRSHTVSGGYTVRRGSALIMCSCAAILVLQIITIPFILALVAMNKALIALWVLLEVLAVLCLVSFVNQPLSFLLGERITIYPRRVLHQVCLWQKLVIDVESTTFFSYEEATSAVIPATWMMSRPCVILYSQNAQYYIFRGLDLAICRRISELLNEKLLLLRHLRRGATNRDIQNILSAKHPASKELKRDPDGVISEELFEDMEMGNISAQGAGLPNRDHQPLNDCICKAIEEDEIADSKEEFLQEPAAQPSPSPLFSFSPQLQLAHEGDTQNENAASQLVSFPLFSFSPELQVTYLGDDEDNEHFRVSRSSLTVDRDSNDDEILRVDSQNTRDSRRPLTNIGAN